MIAFPLLDVLIFLLNIYIGFAYRGTLWGWIATAIVCWFVFNAVRSIKDL